MTRFIGLLLIVSIILVGAHSVKASDSSQLPVETSDLPQSDAGDLHYPWHIAADQISYDQQADQYIAAGNVLMTREGRKISADFARFDHKNMKAFFEGQVIMTAGSDRMTASRLEIDLNTEAGIFYNSQIFLSEKHFYINGDRIDKTGKDSYRAQKASITTCDGPSPDWRITSRRLKVTIEGYGHAAHVSFWAKKIPIFYAPYFIFPVKRKRQSGLLAPQFGYSDRKGEEFVQPFFWAINQSSDATFYLHHMGQRGEKLGMEYRYVIDAGSKGTVMYDYLKDKEVDDGKEDSSELWGYTDDGFLRPNSDRYWFRMKHDHELPSGFFLALDLDIVSDQDYLVEFQDRNTGFDHTQKIFNETFRRQIDAETDPVRVNRLNLSKSWDRYSLNAEMRWYDDIIVRTQTKSNSTLQSLPAVVLSGSRRPLFQTPIYFNFESTYTNFFRIEGQRWQQTDINTRFSLPTTFGNYLSFEPSLRVNTANWLYSSPPGGSGNPNKMFFRTMYDVSLDFSSDLYRIFDVSPQTNIPVETYRAFDPAFEKDLNTDLKRDIIADSQILDVSPQTNIPVKTSRAFDPAFEKDLNADPKRDIRVDSQGVDKIKHSVRPQVVFNHRPQTDHDRFGVNKASTITYSLTNTLTARSLNPPAPSDDPAPEASVAKPTYSYRQLAYLKLEQTYDRIEGYADKVDSRPFSNLTATFQFNPFSYLSFQSDAQWSPYENKINTHNESMTISDKRGDSLYIEHRYSRLASESLYALLHLKLTDRITASFEYEVDMFNDDVFRSNVSLTYRKQCWSFGLRYVNEPLNKERRYEFMITLHGIGGFGTQVSERGSGEEE